MTSDDQVLATSFHRRDRLDLATAVLWPIAASAWSGWASAMSGSHKGGGSGGGVSGANAVAAAAVPRYARAGLQALAWQQQQQQSFSEATAADESWRVLEWLGEPWHDPNAYATAIAALSGEATQLPPPSSAPPSSAPPSYPSRAHATGRFVERLQERAAGATVNATVATVNNTVSATVSATVNAAGATVGAAGEAAPIAARAIEWISQPSQQQQQQQPFGAPSSMLHAPPQRPPPPHPPSTRSLERPSGVIVYLCCSDQAEVADLRRSLRYLYEFFNAHPRYSVVIFHDLLSEEQEGALRAQAALGIARAIRSELTSELTSEITPEISFERLSDDVFAFPATMSAAERAALPHTIRGFGFGYRHMCRFFSGPLFSHRALASYEFVWRLDTDSFLLGPPTSDPFVQMVRANASYGWLHAYRDEAVFVRGLWETTRAFLAREGLDEQRVREWLPASSSEGLSDAWDDARMCFATNCFLARRDWFTSAQYQRYFGALDAAGGFYTDRWGDACVHMLAVAAMLPRAAVLQLRSLAYWHQGTVILPAGMRRAAHALLGEAAVPEGMFAEASVDGF